MELESDPVVKSDLLTTIAANELRLGHYQLAATRANAAAAMDTNNGTALVVLALSYNGGASQCDGIERKAVNWLIVDVLQTARQRVLNNPGPDMSVRDIDANIAQFSVSFPNTDDAFWYQDYKNGDKWTVKCGWISGTTTVRWRQK